MCGISCYFSKFEQKKQLLDSLKVLNHRGPDAASSLFLSGGAVGLGHVRLSIVDLFGGQQPLVSVTGDIFCVVNGEFYEYKKIREDLLQKGYTFRTNSDSEILIPLYQEYGLKLFDHLIGEFSFVLYDQTLNRILCARDRFGIKPLFYYKNQDSFFVSSEIKGLLAYEIPSKWNLDAVFFADFFIPSQKQTYFENVFAVKPGHYCILENETFKEECYWDSRFPVDDDFSPISTIEIDHFRDLLVDCIRTRLHGDVPIAAYVSGGLDSSAILSIVSKILGKQITCFNIRFDHKDYDESVLSKEVSDFLGVSYIPVDATATAIADHFSQAIYHNEGLIYNNQSVAKFLLSKAVRNSGYKVVLTGEGADEILAGYPFFREDLLRQDQKDLSLKCLRDANATVSHVFLSSDNNLYNLEEVLPYLNYIPSMWRVGARYGHLFQENIYSQDFKTSTAKRNPYIELIQTLDLSKILTTHPMNRSLYLWSKTNLPEVILSFLGDRMEMAHSIEGRLPFLDHRLVEQCQRLKLSAKIHNQKEKYILREAVKNIIPESIYHRQKFPFSAPPVIGSSDVAFTPLHTMMMDIIHSQKMKAVPFYNQKKVIDYLNSLKEKSQKERAIADPIINRVVSAAVMAETFKLS